jgi:hypothetical protein
MTCSISELVGISSALHEVACWERTTTTLATLFTSSSTLTQAQRETTFSEPTVTHGNIKRKLSRTMSKTSNCQQLKQTFDHLYKLID